MNLRAAAHIRHTLAGKNLKQTIHPMPYRESRTHIIPRQAVRELLAAETPVNLLIRNGYLHNQDHDEPIALAIAQGRITWIGPDNQAHRYLHEDTTVIHAKGATLLPGMTDSHVHLTVGAERLDGLDVESIRSKEDLYTAIRTYADKNPDRPVLHVYGLHYMDPPLISGETARFELDKLISDRPLFVYAHDLHTGWVNTEALKQAEMLHPMPPFPLEIEELNAQGNMERDTQGIPTGELREPDAYFLVEGILRTRYPEPMNRRLDCLENACRELSRYGITSVHNMGLSLPEEDIEVTGLLLELEHTGRLPVRVFQSCSVVPDEHMLADIALAADVRDLMTELRAGRMKLKSLQHHLASLLQETVHRRNQLERPEHSRTLHKVQRIIHDMHVQAHLERLQHMNAEARDHHRMNPMVHMQTVKIFIDGVMEKDTAHRSGGVARAGVPAFNQAELDETVRTADALGLQVAAHCIGEGAVHMMLNAVERARSVNLKLDEQRGHRIRHRVEHIELCLAEDVPRFAALDVVASMQPFHQRPPVTLWHEKVDAAWWGMAFPWKKLVESGTTMVFGSDWPIVSCDCLEAVRHVRAREAWQTGLENQALSLETALAGFCANPPVAVHREQTAGRLETGMDADITVLNGRLHTDEETPAANLHVTTTICNGRIRFEG